MTSANSQKQPVTYLAEQIPEFLKTWAQKLKQAQLNTARILEEFVLFWESAQLYFSPKNSSNVHSQKIMMKLGLEMDLFPEHIPRVTQTLLYFMDEDRYGNFVPASQIKKIIKIMPEIGLAAENNVGLLSLSSRNHIYDPKYFENAIIENLTTIYGQRTGDWLQMTTPEYCRLGLTYYLQELKRAEAFYPLSYEKVRKLLINVIIIENYEDLCASRSSGILQQLSEKAITDLKAVYALFKQSAINKQEFCAPIKKFCSLFNDYVSQQIMSILTQLREGSENVITITQEIIEMNTYIETVLKEVFDNDKDMVKESNRLFSQSLNAEKRIPLLFAGYAHFLLTEGLAHTSSDQDLDAFFRGINKIYDKDIFLSKLRELLALRLLEKTSIDIERKFLGKMSTDWGLDAQSKMKCMLDDHAISDEVLKDWKSSSNYNLKGIDFSIKILRTACWPERLFVKEKQLKIFCDPILQDLKKKFTTYYQNKNEGKNLQWVINYGTLEIKTSGFKMTNFLRTTPIQMAILLLFNEADSLTYNEIKMSLGFSEDSSDLWEALRFFTSKLKLIIREQAMDEEVNEEEPGGDEKFRVNMGFKNYSKNIDCVSNHAQELARDLETSEYADDRAYVVDSVIVRITKCRREIALSDLQIEVGKMISLFDADSKLVKRRVDWLMERDYLERHSDKKDVLIYKR